MNWKLFDNDVGGQTAYIPNMKNSIDSFLPIIGGFASSILQNDLNSERDYQQYKYQQSLMREQNAYNSAPEQRKRLEQAGINAALAFANGATGAVGSTPSVPQHSPADFSQLGAGFSSSAAQLLQSRQVSAQNELMKEQSEAQRIENRFKALEAISNISDKLAAAQKSGSETKWLEWQLDRSQSLFDAEQKKAYHEILAMDAQARLDNANAYVSEVNGRFAALKNKYELKFTDAQIRHVEADIKRVVAETGVLDEQKLYHILDNAKMIPDVKKALRMSERMDENPNETEILDALGLWLDPVTDAIGSGVQVSNARNYGRSVRNSKPQPRAKVKRERTTNSAGQWLEKEYTYD